MPRLTVQSWKTLQKVFELDGFAVSRVKGSHIAMTRDGVLRPVIIPKYPEVGLDIIRNCMRTAGMSRKKYLALLGSV